MNDKTVICDSPVCKFCVLLYNHTDSHYPNREVYSLSQKGVYIYYELIASRAYPKNLRQRRNGGTRTERCQLFVPKGEFVAVVGESGSGKSTLLNMIGALDTPTSGRVFIDGKNTFAMREKELTIFRRRNIGFIFQAFNLIPELSVEQNMIFPLLLDRQRPNRNYLEELLAILGLEKRRGHLPSQLSGGQQQRVAIGRALMTRPSLVLADEPTGNLDSQNSSEVLALLKKTARQYEQTVIMITHNPAIAQTADRVLRVSDGILSDLGEASEGRCLA